MPVSAMAIRLVLGNGQLWPVFASEPSQEQASEIDLEYDAGEKKEYHEQSFDLPANRLDRTPASRCGSGCGASVYRMGNAFPHASSPLLF